MYASIALNMARILRERGEAAAAILLSGGIGVLRSDTVYGVMALAANKRAVERLYQVKGRSPDKPPVIMIAGLQQIIGEVDEMIQGWIGDLWPGKNSLIIEAPEAPEWLTRGVESLAYRVPDDAGWREFLVCTGALATSSANPEGMPTATTIQEAVAYFGESVDFYVDGGRVDDNTPSRLFRVVTSGLERLR